MGNIDYSAMGRLGFTPITAPQTLHVHRQLAGVGTGEFDAIRFALGAEEQTAVGLLSFRTWFNAAIVDGNTWQAGVIADPDETGTGADVLWDNPNTAFINTLRQELATSGASVWGIQEDEAIGMPYLTLRDCQIYSFAATSIFDGHHSLIYQYFRLTDQAYRALIGRSIRG